MPRLEDNQVSNCLFINGLNRILYGDAARHVSTKITIYPRNPRLKNISYSSRYTPSLRMVIPALRRELKQSDGGDLSSRIKCGMTV